MNVYLPFCDREGTDIRIRIQHPDPDIIPYTLYTVPHPSRIERLLGITYEKKVRAYLKKAMRYCYQQNKKADEATIAMRRLNANL